MGGFDAEWLARHVTDGLRDGSLSPGDLLGSERELAERFGVTRTALRHALQPLERHGLVRRVAGRGGGTFVGDFTLERDLSTIVSVVEYLREQGFEAGTRVLSAAILRGDDVVTGALELPTGSFVVELMRVRSANGVPIVLEHSHLPADRFPGLLELPLGGSVIELLERHYGLVQGEVAETLQAINAGPEEAGLLGVEPGAALMEVTRTSATRGGFLFEYSQDLFRGDHTRMVVRAPGGSGVAGAAAASSRDLRVLPHGRGR